MFMKKENYTDIELNRLYCKNIKTNIIFKDNIIIAKSNVGGEPIFSVKKGDKAIFKIKCDHDYRKNVISLFINNELVACGDDEHLKNLFDLVIDKYDANRQQQKTISASATKTALDLLAKTTEDYAESRRIMESLKKEAMVAQY